MSALTIDPELAGKLFVAVLLGENFDQCGLALSGSATSIEYEPGKWSVSAEVLTADGRLERRVMPESFPAGSEARDLVDHINGSEEQL
jgi:hypothetical protein